MKKSNLLSILTVCMVIVVTLSAFAIAPASANEQEAVTNDDMTTTTTAVMCYATQAEYDNTPMSVGETRAIRFYHPVTKTAAGGSIDEVGNNLSYTYEEGSDTVYVTALAAGDASLYIRETNCAFGTYVYLTVENSMSVGGIHAGDIDRDGQLTTRDARYILMYCLGKIALTTDLDTTRTADYNGDGIINTTDVRNLLHTLITL